MKKYWSLMLALVLAVTMTTAGMAAGSQSREYPGSGFTIEVPEEFSQLQGQLYIDEEKGNDPVFFCVTFAYEGVTEEERSAIYEKYNNGTLTDEEYVDYLSKIVYIGALVAMEGENSDISILSDGAEATLLGVKDGYTFGYLELMDPESLSHMNEVCAKEAETLKDRVKEIALSAKYAKPVDSGTKISFTAVDADGKEHTSEELFAANKYTMINVWGSWCGPCVSELEELGKIHQRMREKGCGILGVEFEYTPDEATLQSAKQLLANKGATYPNVIVNDSMAFMNDIEGFPSSIFVDSEGNVVAEVIIGVAVDQYETVLQSLLEK